MVRNLAVIATLSLVFVSVQPALAAGVSPKRPSSIFTLFNSGAAGACAGARTEVNTMVAADGSQSPLAIPAGEVFVITSVDYLSLSGGTAGRRYAFVLSSGLPVVVIGDAGVSDAGGLIAGSVSVPGGVVVKSGTTLCVGFENPVADIAASSRIHGFFTKDK